MSVYYTCGCSRDVRGNCGKKHRTIDAAENCIKADQRGCASQGGYSDRSIHKFENGEEIELEENEQQWLYRS